MRKLIYVIVAMTLCSIIFSCRTKYVHVPVETIQKEKEYIEKWHRDSIHIKDSIIINKAGDTIFIEKYKYIYKDKLVKDSIIITDSIKVDVPYPIEIVKEVNILSSFQSFQLWCGRILLLLLFAYFGAKGMKRFI